MVDPRSPFAAMQSLNEMRFEVIIGMPKPWFTKPNPSLKNLKGSAWIDQIMRNKQEALEQAGLRNMPYLWPSGFCMHTKQITTADLRTMLEIQITQHLDPEINETGKIPFADLEKHQVYAWNGGAYVFENSEIIFEPQCCTGIADISSWNRIMSLADGEETAVWFGHPCIFARCRGAQIQLTSYIEEESQLHEGDFCYEISRPALLMRLQQLEHDWLQFRDRCAGILSEMGARNSMELASRICGWER